MAVVTATHNPFASSSTDFDDKAATWFSFPKVDEDNMMNSLNVQGFAISNNTHSIHAAGVI